MHTTVTTLPYFTSVNYLITTTNRMWFINVTSSPRNIGIGHTAHKWRIDQIYITRIFGLNLDISLANIISKIKISFVKYK